MSYIPIKFGMSTGGNTSGSSGTVSNQIVFAGGNNITLSQSTSGGSATISISGGAGGAAGSNTFGMSNIGNTSGTSGTVNGSAVQFAFAGGNNITLSQSLNGSSGTITISAGAGGGGAFTGGMSNIGNTSGTTGAVGSQLVLAGGNNVTLSQSVNGQSATVTISAGAGGGGGGGTFSSTVIGKENAWAQSSSSLGQNSLYIQPHNLQNNLSAIAVKMPVLITNSSLASSSGQVGHTAQFAIYTTNATNSTVLSLHYSTSYTAAFSMSSNVSRAASFITGIGNNTSYNTVSSSSAGLNLSSVIHGPREFMMPVSSLLSAGKYWFAYKQSSSLAGTSNSVFAVSHIIYSSQTGAPFGGATSATSFGGIAKNMGLGTYSTTTAAMPNGISLTQINKAATQPVMYIMPVTS